MHLKGFTLLELLVTIGVLGILSTVVLVSINPLEKLRQSKDAIRKSGISQLATALRGYYVNYFAYPPNSYTYMNVLVAAGEISTPISPVSNTAACLGGVYYQNGFCYHNAGAYAYVMIPLESNREKQKCSTGDSYYMWDPKQGKIGVVCVIPPFWSLGNYTFQD